MISVNKLPDPFLSVAVHPETKTFDPKTFKPRVLTDSSPQVSEAFQLPEVNNFPTIRTGNEANKKIIALICFMRADLEQVANP